MEAYLAKQKAILDFLKAAGLLVTTDITSLEGQVIPRDLLISAEKYEECQPHLDVLRNCLSSSRLTCLQATAETSQRWPLLNAVRQLLKSNMFRMVPFRLSDGYTKQGKKILRRFFRIERIKSVKPQTSQNGDADDDEAAEDEDEDVGCPSYAIEKDEE